MKDNNSSRWSIGCKIVQWRINTQIHRGIGNKIPYELAFGQMPRSGISSLPLCPDLLDTIATEAQLNQILNTSTVSPREPSISIQNQDEHSNLNNSRQSSNQSSSSVNQHPIKPTCLKLNTYGKFPRVECSFCNRGVLTENRCRHPVENGMFMYKPNAGEQNINICGKAFCIMCAEEWDNWEDRHRCKFHGQQKLPISSEHIEKNCKSNTQSNKPSYEKKKDSNSEYERSDDEISKDSSNDNVSTLWMEHAKKQKGKDVEKLFISARLLTYFALEKKSQQCR